MTQDSVYLSCKHLLSQKQCKVLNVNKFTAHELMKTLQGSQKTLSSQRRVVAGLLQLNNPSQQPHDESAPVSTDPRVKTFHRNVVALVAAHSMKEAIFNM